MPHAVPITRSGDSQPIRPDGVVLLDPATGIPYSAAGGGASAGLTDAQLRATRINTEPLGTPGAARQLTATATTANTALTTTARRVSLRCRSADCRFAIGVGAQTASATASHFIGADERLDFAVPANAQIAVIRNSEAAVNGVIELMELS